MEFKILLATTLEEKEAVYRFRYKIYIEELKKHHIPADHKRKIICDEADESALIFYAFNQGREILGTVRLLIGRNGFPKYLIDYFDIDSFKNIFPFDQIAIIDKLMVKPAYRSLQLGHNLSLATFFEGPKHNIRIVFMTSEERIMPMHIRYGWRCYSPPKTIDNEKKRYNFIFFTQDYAYLAKIHSPFLPFIPNDLLNISDESVVQVEAMLGQKLYIPKLNYIQNAFVKIIKYTQKFNKVMALKK